MRSSKPNKVRNKYQKGKQKVLNTREMPQSRVSPSALLTVGRSFSVGAVLGTVGCRAASLAPTVMPANPRVMTTGDVPRHHPLSSEGRITLRLLKATILI